MSKLNFILWALIPLFEAFRNRFGIGLIFRQCFEFRDLSGLFALSFATAIIIILGDLLLKFIHKMLIHWEP
jgi:ABC-type nitrate/sulfonate/bicarbonate transport system permease component